MAINPNLTLQFAQNLGQSRPLTELGSSIGQIIQQRRMRNAQEDMNRQYQDALRNWRQNQTPENRMSLYQAAEPLGRFESVRQQIADLTEDQRRTEVRRNLDIIGNLSAGNTDYAVSQMQEIARALEQDGDSQGAERWRGFVSAAEEGNPESVTAYLSAITGIDEIGSQAIDNFLNLRSARRQDIATDADILQMVADTPFASEEARQRSMELADGLPSGLGSTLVQMMSVGSMLGADGAGGMEVSDLLDVERQLRNDLDTDVSNFLTVINSFDQISAVENLDDPTGMGDQALITLYNKVLDPNSVVRESEAARTAGAVGLLDRADAAFRGIESGVTLSANARRAIVDASRLIRDIAQNNYDVAIDRTQQTIDFIDPDGILGSANRIFLDRGQQEQGADAQTQESRSLSNVRQQFRELYPPEHEWGNVDIENATLDQLRTWYPGTWERLYGDWNPGTTEMTQEQFQEQFQGYEEF